VRNYTRIKEPDGIHEPNMTPLIDVSLVLVVILMVTTPMAFQSGIQIRNAAKAGRAAERARAERIEITVVSPDSVIVNRTADTVIRLLPALIITTDEIDEALDRLDQALGAVGAH